MLFADAREIHQAFADAADALGDAQHAGQALEGGGVAGVFGEFLDGALEDRERGVELMRHAGAEQAEADQAVLRFEFAERFL